MTVNYFPALNRFFDNLTELAHAGCMSRTRLWECLTGQKEFTRAEKKAISANIMARVMDKNPVDYEALETAHRAWKGEFDTVYRRKDVA